MSSSNSKSFSERYRVIPGSKVELRHHDPSEQDDVEHLDDRLAALRKRLWDTQELLYANHTRSLLIVLQAMDAGGKDGTISHVFGAMNPQGCRVACFKVPSAEELAHDFLWRIHAKTPAKGEVVIFNRSHYEDVLTVRVHNLVPPTVWEHRYRQINDFESQLAASGTLVFKFFLHISADEQLKRFKDRMDEPGKRWKISESDYSERKLWDQYQIAYEDALSRCSTEAAPWFIVPANHKRYRNLVVSEIVLDQIDSLGLQFPKPTVDLERVEELYREAKDAKS